MVSKEIPTENTTTLLNRHAESEESYGNVRLHIPQLEISENRISNAPPNAKTLYCVQRSVKSKFQRDADGLEAPSNKSTSSAEASQFSTKQLVRVEFTHVHLEDARDLCWPIKNRGR